MMAKALNFFTLALIIILTGIHAPVTGVSYAQVDEPKPDKTQTDKTKEAPKQEAEPESAFSDIKLARPVTYPYVEDGDERQMLDFYRYESSRPGLRPVLIWFHGGGWVKGSREWIDPIAFEIASVGGYNLISAGYRLAGDKNVPWPLIIHDVKAVVRWVKLNAKKLRINPEKIIVGGESAGAHLAAMAALSAGVPELEGSENPGVSSNVAAVVLFYGPYNMDTLARKKRKMIKNSRCPKPNYSSPVLYLLDCPNVDTSTYNIDGCKEEDVKQANPATHLDSSDPPVFIAHGKDDCIVPWTQAKEFADALEEAGVPYEFISAKDGEHRVWTLDVEASDVVRFLDKHIDE
jgi:acetyl esterase/lipase